MKKNAKINNDQAAKVIFI